MGAEQHDKVACTTMQSANWPRALVAQPFRQPGLDEQARSQRIQLSNVPCDQRPVLLSPTHLQIGRASGANRAASMHCMDSRFGPNGISMCDTNAFGPVLIHLREQPHQLVASRCVCVPCVAFVLLPCEYSYESLVGTIFTCFDPVYRR